MLHCITYMQSISCEILDWMNHMLEWRVPGERSTTSCMQMIPLNGRKWRTEEPLDESGRRSGKTALKLNIQNTKIMVSSSITSWQTEKWRHWQILFSWAPKSLWIGDCSHEIKRYLLLGRKTVTNLDSILKSRDSNLLTKVCIVKAMVSSGHVWMWELNHKEDWVPKNWCLWTVVLEKTLESPLDCKEIKPVNPKGNQYWIFIGRIEAGLKLQYSSCLMWRTNSLEKTLNAEKDWRQEEKEAAEDEMVREHSITDSVVMNLSKLWEMVKDREAWHASVHGVTESDMT